MSAERGEYKGTIVLTLKRDPDDKYPFSFGYGKAKLIVDNFEAIKTFVEEESKKKAPTS